MPCYVQEGAPKGIIRAVAIALIFYLVEITSTMSHAGHAA